MPKAVPLSPHLVRAACELHATLEPWRRSDEALLAIKIGVEGFGPAATLAKVAALDALYHTRVFALARVSEHFARVLTHAAVDAAGPELVEDLADVPQGGAERRPARRLSLAAKFAHFFIDAERFPIYDRFALRVVARHAGTPRAALARDYAAFKAAFDAVAVGAGILVNRRRLDRYLWIEGQYEDWSKRGRPSSTYLEAAFRRGDWPPADTRG